MEGRATFVELLGRETLVGVEVDGDVQLSLLADADASVAPGDRVRFGIEPHRLYLFDVDTSRALATL